MNKPFSLFIIMVAFFLFPQCGRTAKPPAENFSETKTTGNGGEAALPEIDPAVREAFETLGIPVLRQPIPLLDFSAETPDGKTITLKDLTGKVLFLNFWATWCGPCRMEMPSMETLYQRFKDQGLEILAVNYMESKKDVAAFMDEYDLSFAAALDTSGVIAMNYAVEAFPTTYIIDRNGRIITRLVGAINWDVPELSDAFRVLLNTPVY